MRCGLTKRVLRVDGTEIDLNGERLVLEILLTRKAERHLQNKVLEIDPKAFMVSYDPKYIHGGFWSKRVHLDK